MSTPFVITVILNTNRRDDTLACLASLGQSNYPNHKIIVLDNASSDGSAEVIAAQFPEVQLLPLTENLGYAGNNNVGIVEAIAQKADWIFVLNEDTIVDADCISQLVKIGEQSAQIGMVGPMVYHYEESTRIQSAGGRLGPRWQSQHIGQNEPDQGQFSQPHKVDWISGCALLVRTAVVEQVGPLDERFFYYWEETEWCLRTARAGWQIVHIPAAKLWHKGVQPNYQPGPNVTYYSTRNRFLMMAKHKAPLAIRTAVWLETGRTLLSWSVRPKWRHLRPHRDAMWQGIVDFLRHRWGMRVAS